MRPEQQRVKQLLTEAISLLCRNSLQFKEDVTVEGLLGITLDKSDIFLVSINETIQQTLRESTLPEKRSIVDTCDTSHSPKKRRRRGSREGSSSPSPSPHLPVNQSPVSSSENENIKQEIHGDIETKESSKHGSEDGRKFHPAHDSTSELPNDKKPPVPPPVLNAGGCEEATQVQVKQELPDAEEEEEECYLIDSDSQDGSHASLPPDDDGGLEQSWSSASANQTGFNLTELDMMSAANFQHQFGNVGLEGGTNNMGNVSWDPSQMEGHPSTSGAADGSARDFPCRLCRRAFKLRHHLDSHVREVHLKQRAHSCPFCHKSFLRIYHVKRHFHSCTSVPESLRFACLSNQDVEKVMRNMNADLDQE